MNDKKYGLLKVVGIAFLLYVLLTWFIPTGSFSGGEFVKGDVSSVGLYGIFSSLSYCFAVFSQYLILILCVGGFYGVLNKTQVYQNIVSLLASKNVKFVLVFTIVLFGLISSVFGEVMMTFILLPFFVAVLIKAGYDKLSSLAATVGGSLIGIIASISGNMAIYKNYFNLEPKVFVIYNIIMFIILVFLFSMYIIGKNNKKNAKALEIPLFETVKSSKKSSAPLIIILSFMVILLTMGLFNWQYSFGISIFSDLHEKLTSIELFNIGIVSRIFGSLTKIGYFSNYDVCAILIIGGLLISWVYSVKFDEFISSFKSGASEMLLPGLYVLFASLIFSLVVTSGNGNIGLTISNSILGLSSDFNIVTGILTGICGSFFYNDYLYLMNGLYGIVSLYNTSQMPFILSLFQSMFGLMMFILPVSITLIGGLKYLNVSYKDWIKYIWKFFVQIFLISVIGCIILSMIV